MGVPTFQGRGICNFSEKSRKSPEKGLLSILPGNVDGMGILISASPSTSSRLTGKKNVESILIPESFLKRLTDLERKNLPKNVGPLLDTYTKYLVSLRRLNPRAKKVMYQRGEGKLIKVNMRIAPEHWELLRVIANSHGVSKSFLFNYILWLDSLGVGESFREVLGVGVPTLHNSYSYTLHYDTVQNKISRSLQFRPEFLKTVRKYRKGYF